MVENLGINTIHVTVDQLKTLGLGRVEMCLGRHGTHNERLAKMEGDIQRAQMLNIPFSIHLPMYIFDWFDGDYLDVFFLDSDLDKRELSYKLLEENLKRVSLLKPDYCVLHFAGVYGNVCGTFDDFKDVLKEAFQRINNMGKQYGVHILLEYMGSNIRFSDYKDWISGTKSLSHVGLLVDTGHLYFASLIHNFDYMEALDKLSSVAEAFHLWTTKGYETYGDSEYYQKFHHIIPHVEQLSSEGWAFDTEAVLERIARENRPMIIEASTVYKGRDYFYEGVSFIISFLEGNVTR